MTKGPSTRTVIFLSAMMPGLGQLIQKRWIPAIVYGVGFTYFCVVVMGRVIRAMLTTLKATLDFAGGGPNSPFATLAVRDILIPLGFSLLFYVVGLLDTYWGCRRGNRIE